jgi:hypothetical protein
MTPRRVLIESPYAADTGAGIEANLAYARLCLRDSLSRGEAPFARHIVYTQCLNDNLELERTMGIRAGLTWGSCAGASCVYTDRGISKGMQMGIDDAIAAGRPIEYRTLPVDISARRPAAITATERQAAVTGWSKM